jgi:hypothetical protein
VDTAGDAVFATLDRPDRAIENQVRRTVFFPCGGIRARVTSFLEGACFFNI